MTRRAAPLLIDRLPLYASDAELRAAIWGARGENEILVSMWKRFGMRPDFPKFNWSFSGRHVPSVLKWFDDYENGDVAATSPPDGSERETSWNTPKRRGSSSGRAQVGRQSRTG